jgi:uncharacterized protein YcfJ
MANENPLPPHAEWQADPVIAKATERAGLDMNNPEHQQIVQTTLQHLDEMSKAPKEQLIAFEKGLGLEPERFEAAQVEGMKQLQGIDTQINTLTTKIAAAQEKAHSSGWKKLMAGIGGVIGGGVVAYKAADGKGWGQKALALVSAVAGGVLGAKITSHFTTKPAVEEITQLAGQQNSLRESGLQLATEMDTQAAGYSEELITRALQASMYQHEHQKQQGQQEQHPHPTGHPEHQGHQGQHPHPTEHHAAAAHTAEIAQERRDGHYNALADNNAASVASAAVNNVAAPVETAVSKAVEAVQDTATTVEKGATSLMDRVKAPAASNVEAAIASKPIGGMALGAGAS